MGSEADFKVAWVMLGNLSLIEQIVKEEPCQHFGDILKSTMMTNVEQIVSIFLLSCQEEGWKMHKQHEQFNKTSKAETWNKLQGDHKQGWEVTHNSLQ